MKQTAVEWLVEQLQIFATEEEMNIIEQAKAMEQVQIITAHKTATLEAGFEHSADDWANQYYNQIYKSE